MAEPVKTEDKRPDAEPPRQLFVTPTHDTIRKLLAAGGGAPMKLWFALALRADWRTGEAWPSYETLKSDHGFSSNCIAAGIQGLEELGLLERRRRFGNSTRYFLQGFARVGGSSLNPQGTHPHIERDLAAYFSRIETSDESDSPEKRESALSKGEASPPIPQAQSSHSLETNDPQGTTSSRNEMGGGSAARHAPATEADLVRLTRERAMLALSETQRVGMVRSIVELLGFDAAAKALAGGGFGGWDLKDVHRHLARAYSKKDPPPGRKADPDCKSCDGKGRKKNPATGRDMDCSCVR